MKQTYRALSCFLIDFWDHTECEPHTDPATVQQLQTLPVEKGQSKCFHLAGQQGGRVCFVHAVLGTSLTNNKEVRGWGWGWGVMYVRWVCCVWGGGHSSASTWRGNKGGGDSGTAADPTCQEGTVQVLPPGREHRGAGCALCTLSGNHTDKQQRGEGGKRQGRHCVKSES
jgi:hypothetical protein